METHSKETPHKCATCGKGFKLKHNLTTHQRVHTGERAHTCLTCNKSFSQKGHLSSHMLTHSEEVPHQCSTCGRRFKRKNSLKRHRRVHIFGRTYVCSVCQRSYRHGRSLSYHMEIHRNEVMQESFGNEAEQSEEISSAYKSLSSTNGDWKKELCLTNLPALHSSDVPFIINVKTEEDM